MTPGASRPGSALSTSTSVSGVLYRRTTQSARKPRPASIAGTGMSIDSMSMTHIDPFHPIRAVLIEINVCFFFLYPPLDDIHKQRKEKPPIPRVQSTAARKLMTTSLTHSINSTPVTAPATPKETPKRSTPTEKRTAPQSAKKV